MNRKDCVELCKRGDRQALGLLYATYSPAMMRICLRYVSNRQAALDILHDGFILIFTSIGTLRNPEKLENWMGKIMKNLSLKYLAQCEPVCQVSLSEMERGEDPDDGALFDFFPSGDTILKMIEELPDGYRKVFKLSVLDGLSHKEIASLLNIAPHSSSSQLSRAKEMLRKWITEPRVGIVLLLLLVMPFAVWLTKKRSMTESERKEGFKNEAGKQKAEPLALSPADSVAASSASMPNHWSVALGLAEDSSEKEPSLGDSVVVAIGGSDSLNGRNRNVGKTKNEAQLRFPTIAHRSNNPRDLSLALVYSGGRNRIRTSTAFGDASSGLSDKRRVRHYAPTTISLSIHKKLSERWGVETGIRYTHLRTDFTTIGESVSEEKQRIDYLGVPLIGVLQIGKYERFSVYASAGVLVEMPIRATSEESRMGGEASRVMTTRILKMPLQWSVNIGTGLLYHITPSIGLYAEPSIHYYFNDGSRLNTGRKEHPLDLSLPVGIRISW